MSRQDLDRLLNFLLPFAQDQFSMRRPSRVKANVVASEVWQRSHALFPFALAWGVVGPGAVWGP
jgi:hypothetical protein